MSMSSRQSIFREALGGVPVNDIAARVGVSRKHVGVTITGLVHDGYLRREGGALVAGHRTPPSEGGQHRGLPVSLLDLWRHHLQQLVSEAEAVKAQIERTRACDRGTLTWLYADGRSIAAEARALTEAMALLEAGALTERHAQALFTVRLIDARRGDVSDRVHYLTEATLTAVDAARAEVVA